MRKQLLLGVTCFQFCGKLWGKDHYQRIINSLGDERPSKLGERIWPQRNMTSKKDDAIIWISQFASLSQKSEGNTCQSYPAKLSNSTIVKLFKVRICLPVTVVFPHSSPIGSTLDGQKTAAGVAPLHRTTFGVLYDARLKTRPAALQGFSFQFLTSMDIFLEIFLPVPGDIFWVDLRILLRFFFRFQPSVWFTLPEFC